MYIHIYIHIHTVHTVHTYIYIYIYIYARPSRTVSDARCPAPERGRLSTAQVLDSLSDPRET